MEEKQILTIIINERAREYLINISQNLDQIFTNTCKKARKD